MAVALTIFGKTTKIIDNIKPDSIEMDEQSGKTYINLQPVTSDSGWRPLEPETLTATTFTLMQQIAVP